MTGESTGSRHHHGRSLRNTASDEDVICLSCRRMPERAYSVWCGEMKHDEHGWLATMRTAHRADADYSRPRPTITMRPAGQTRHA